MAQQQSGITPDANSDALFLVLSLKNPKESSPVIKATLRQIPDLTQTLSNTYPQAQLSSTVAIGSYAWDQLFTVKRPAELTPFKPVSDGDRTAPATPGDILLHIRSDRHDLNFKLQSQIMLLFGDSVQIQEDIHGFRYLDSRDLTGFVDGTENPAGDNRASVTLVGDEDAAFSGGAYIHTQRYIHNLKHWQKQPVVEQEKVIGRTREENIEFSGDEKAPTAHVKKSNIKNTEGKSMEILRHSMPYGNASESGLFFASYCRTPEHFEKMLEAMIQADSHGHYDHLMDYSNAVTGCLFFAPSVDFLDVLS
ncbi:peroxidase [Endozoicomonas sp. OPT23]|uniref:Dyp-type peroxidase n=1 Tax=Endozoicomonas sp. OPT23 TaxID=2072845 RepID=UPI00129B5692|nr:Dyp-type peroxidase [Endozoicomonas sp. OPT23]MRI35406.1 peroxidase [Endozoicomonas sp. OPT23]